MTSPLARHLAREQRAFLGRDRQAWGEHLAKVRGFLGEGLARADRHRPTLVLGAGSGLEVPWVIAPPDRTGWDADPWSRLRTALRHRCWPAWVFADVTGAMADLEAAVRRCARQPWGGGRPNDRTRARTRLAGLLPSLEPKPAALRDWIAARQPATILSANLLGQFGAVAQALLAAHLGRWWEEDFPPEDLDPALEGWTARVLRAHLAELAGSSAELWLVYDRGVVHGGEGLDLGPWTDPWPEQLRGLGTAEIEDPLAGIDPVRELEGRGRPVARRERWLWPLAPGQTHLVEAVACLAARESSRSPGAQER